MGHKEDITRPTHSPTLPATKTTKGKPRPNQRGRNRPRTGRRGRPGIRRSWSSGRDRQGRAAAREIITETG